MGLGVRYCKAMSTETTVKPYNCIFTDNSRVNRAVQDIYRMQGMQEADPGGTMGTSIVCAIEGAIRASRPAVADISTDDLLAELRYRVTRLPNQPCPTCAKSFPGGEE
jgi:hypothetical protein